MNTAHCSPLCLTHSQSFKISGGCIEIASSSVVDALKGQGLGLESRYPRQFSGLYNYLPWLWNSTCTVSSPWGECSHAAYKRQRFYTIHNILFPFHQVPITVGWPEVVWIQSLPKASSHDRRRGNRTPGL